MVRTKSSCPGTSTTPATRPSPSGERGEVEIDGDAPAPLLRQPVHRPAGQRGDQRRLAVVDVPRRADDHAAIPGPPEPELQRRQLGALAEMVPDVAGQQAAVRRACRHRAPAGSRPRDRAGPPGRRAPAPAGSSWRRARAAHAVQSAPPSRVLNGSAPVGREQRAVAHAGLERRGEAEHAHQVPQDPEARAPRPRLRRRASSRAQGVPAAGRSCRDGGRTGANRSITSASADAVAYRAEVGGEPDVQLRAGRTR